MYVELAMFITSKHLVTYLAEYGGIVLHPIKFTTLVTSVEKNASIGAVINMKM